VVIYAFFGVLWILLSDRLLFALITDPITLTNIQTAKGWFYVLLTALLLYLLVGGMYSRLQRINAYLVTEKNYSHNLIHQLPIGLALCRMDGQLVDVNPSYAAIIGRSIDETLALSFWEITPKKYAEEEQAQLDSLLERGRYGPYEKEYIHKNGHHVPVRLSGLVVERQGEKLIWSSVEDISARKLAENALRRSEHVLRLFVEHAPAAIAMLDRDLHYIVASRRYLVDYDLSDHDISGRSHYEVFPEIPEHWRKIHRRCLAGAIEKSEEDSFARADGTMDWLRWEIHPWYEREGEIGGIILFSEVITERKKFHEALRLSEEKFAKTFHNSPDAIALTSLPDGNFVEVNERFLDLSGYTSAEIPSRTIFDLGIWGEKADRQRYLDVLQTQHRVTNLEANFHKKSGEVIQCMISGEIIEAQSGNFILNIVRDITESKKAAAEIQRVNDELQTINRIIATCSTTLDTKELLNKFMDEALQITGLEGGTICFVTPDETLEIAAHRATSEATITDLTSHAVKVGDCLCGQCARDFQPLILPDRQAVLKFSTREATRDEDIRFHAAFPLISGERCVGVLCIFTRTDAKPSEQSLHLLNTVSAQIGIAIDNTRLYETSQNQAVILEDKVQKRTAELEKTRRALLNLVEDLNSANDKLQELDRMKSMFIASMSHELRTPLNSIIGFSSILANAWLGPVNQEQRVNLNAIFDSGKHLLEMINDIIDLSKIEAGLLESLPESFDLDALVAEAVKMVAKSTEDKGLAIVVDIAPLQMHTDRRRLLQCLLNLLSNAVKFTGQGKITITGQLGTATQGVHMVELAVQDTGIGIRPEDKKLLFKPFVRLHSSDNATYPGTGLGLYLTRKLTQEVLEGEISLHSDFGQGSIFTLRIPVTIAKKTLNKTTKETTHEA
jgi:PAS domain S-box-containing protein